jgi:hypothetical protein
VSPPSLCLPPPQGPPSKIYPFCPRPACLPLSYVYLFLPMSHSPLSFSCEPMTSIRTRHSVRSDSESERIGAVDWRSLQTSHMIVWDNEYVEDKPPLLPKKHPVALFYRGMHRIDSRLRVWCH